MLVEFVVLGTIIGWLRGGRLGRVADVPIRLSWLILAAFGLQIILSHSLGLFDWPRELVLTLLLVSFLALIGVLVYNYLTWKEWAMLLMALGLLLNFLVIAVNGGMPVSVELTERYQSTEALQRLKEDPDLLHVPLTDGSSLSFLADVIPIPPPYPASGIISLGDIVLAIGVLLFVQRAMLYQGKRIVNRGSVRNARRLN